MDRSTPPTPSPSRNCWHTVAITEPIFTNASRNTPPAPVPVLMPSTNPAMAGITLVENTPATLFTTGRSMVPMDVFMSDHWAARIRCRFARPSLVLAKSPCASAVCL